MKIIFLDIDGVMNTEKTPTRWHKDGHLLMMDQEKVFWLNNLVVCSRSENALNRIKYKCNPDGFKNVSWDKNAKKWTARVTRNGKSIYLGIFKSKRKALNVVKKFLKYGHQNN